MALPSRSHDAGPHTASQGDVLNMANTASRTHLPVTEAYAGWAEVYDSDSNPLQAVDSIAMRTLLPAWASLLSNTFSNNSASEGDGQPPLVIDLGCGTGRNTLAVLALALSESPPPCFASGARILALDITPEMLAVAEKRCSALLAAAPRARSEKVVVAFRTFDLLAHLPPNAAQPTTHLDRDDPAIPYDQAHAILSSLVVEHVPMAAFFKTCSSLLTPGGLLLATNMHPDMGRRSGAGYTDSATGQKIRVHGYTHEVADFWNAAATAGFTPLSTDCPREMAITAAMLQHEPSLRQRGHKWLGIKIWMGGIWRNK